MPNFIDIHVHTTIKPYGKSYYVNNAVGIENNSFDLTSESSVWYKDKVGVIIDKLLENTVGFSAYRQSDFTSLVDGGVRVIMVSLYPIEKGFFLTKQNLSKHLREYIGNWITMIGQARINDVLSDDFDYWEDLKFEYDFLKLLDNKVPTYGNKRFKLVGAYHQIDLSVPDVVYVVLSVEGAHAFCEGTNTVDANNWANLVQNIALLKDPTRWPHTPFFITFGHHFYNGLCAHAESLPDALKKFVDQDTGMQKPVEGNNYITGIGYQLIDLLYSTSNGKRILVDIKHMAKSTRKEFYAYHAVKYANVPIIYSHGGVRDSDKSYLHDKEINLDKEDISYICKSNGIIGLEIDQRIVGYNENKNRFWKWLTRPFKSRRERNKEWTEPFWNNLIYIAEYCHQNVDSANPWRFLCLGTDYDGIINPLNEFRTADTLPKLREALIGFLNDYWNGSPIIPNNTGGTVEQVVDQIVYQNAWDFMANNY